MKPKGFFLHTATLKAQKKPSHHPNETALLIMYKWTTIRLLPIHDNDVPQALSDIATCHSA